jgi:hypothetical protein
LALCELKSAIAKLRDAIAFARFKRAALRRVIAEHLLRKAGFRPDQPRWPAGSGRISGRWSGGAGTGGPVDPEPERATPTLTDETPDGSWKPGAQYAAGDGHHHVPRRVFESKEYSFRPETRKVFEEAKTGPLTDPNSNRYDRMHRALNDAVKEALDRYLERHKISSSQMTPAQAQDFVQEIKSSTDPRIRRFYDRMLYREWRYWLRRVPRGID